MDWHWFLFSFEGRINRAKLWLAGLVIVSWMIFLGFLIVAAGKLLGGPTSFRFGIDDVFGLVDPRSFRSLSSVSFVSVVVHVIGTPLFLWVYAATSIKRLHDRNRSGWWLVPFFLIPGLYGQFNDRLGDSIPMALCGAVIGIIYFWGYVEMCFLRGTRGPNLFGADPLAPIDTRPRWDQHSELEFVPHRASPSTGPHDKRGA
jgi:uncharacterized membrane protein YhaH (DUF805 family)